ncbi:hypothetical protein ACIBL8_47280 [Streptomyces sp. NPDC050523]|uniref:hypothetical protein n=1 Tax=Streptomyces sp. NPDC050523 TaxID=3365622 RepID=UPI0037A99CF5
MAHDVPVLGVRVAGLGERGVVAKVGVEVPFVDACDLRGAFVESDGCGRGAVLRVDQAGDRRRPVPGGLGCAQVGVGRLQGFELPLVRLPPGRRVLDDLPQVGDVGSVLPLMRAASYRSSMIWRAFSRRRFSAAFSDSGRYFSCGSS